MIGHTAVDKYQQDSCNHRHLADGAVHSWLQKPLQNDGHQEGDDLRAAALQKPPEKAGKDFLLRIVLSFHGSLLRVPVTAVFPVQPVQPREHAL